ncbi:unnamed protein product [Ixodes persulcatus]
MYNLLGFPVYITLCCIAYLLRRLSSAAISRHPVSHLLLPLCTPVTYIHIYPAPPPPVSPFLISICHSVPIPSLSATLCSHARGGRSIFDASKNKYCVCSTL